ncbi:ribonuclease R [Eubacterium oxidoreducens]|nr:ribonuclease R [Eubacterium oxidoreducens]
MDNFIRQKNTIYDFICDPIYKPMKAKEIAMVLGILKEQRTQLHAVLDALVEDGKIELLTNGKYKKSSQCFYCGVYTAHPKGFGFVTVEGLDEDLFVAAEDAGGAFHMDEVKVKVKNAPAGKRMEARVVEVLSHGLTRIVGTYEAVEGFGFVRPDNERFLKDIFISEKDAAGAVDGHKVVVEIKSYGDERHKPEGKIVEILGHKNDPGVDILSIAKDYDFPMEFAPKILTQAINVAKPVSEKDMEGRRDLRQLPMVTIDGEDAKDLDDAVSLEVEDDCYHLGVHIADVTNYVQENSALDKEALKRGTSVYLVDRVIPMLPHTLSNGICSLNEGEERLALSCLMTFDKKGKLLAHEITESVICVNHRMTYTVVNEIVTNHNPEYMEKYADFVVTFEKMLELATILRKKRRARGSIDFDFPETKVILDKQGKPVEIRPYDRNPATKIIEDFMLAANETVAEHYFWQELPFLYRVHEQPDKEKITSLSEFLRGFGVYLNTTRENIHPKELQKILDKIENTPQESLISRLTLRSMKQAKYNPQCLGHFGLAAKYYCHFTSPIRRYPDLQIHRIIKENLRGRLKQERIEHYESILDKVAQNTSKTERRAQEAERETIRMKQAQYMSEHINEIFEGVISSITSFGIYVELENTIEGLVHVTKLMDDYYYYDEEKHRMIGENNQKEYRLGQSVRIRVADTDVMRHTIDFSMVCEEET